MSFERFYNTYELKGKIRMETPLRIGKPIAPYSISSAPVLLQYDAARREYVPFIPGSSLKGVLRSSCERILRSYGEEVCSPPGTCGECRICKVFGAQDKGAKIRVRDCRFSKENIYWRYTEERPHHADEYKYSSNKGRYEAVWNPRGFRTEEDIPPFVFDLHGDMENATEEEVALVILGLEEFNYKRAHIGGGVSRGLGFASVELEEIIEKRVEDFSVKKEKKEIKPLHLTPVTGFKGADDFTSYWKADDDSLNGCIVCELEAECVSDFEMRGMEEKTVSVGGTPIIPGSVIKGFLRKYFINRWEPNTIDDVFGSTQREGHRSRVLVSDAFPVKDLTGDRIPKGTKLKCWIVFDNMEGKDIKEILGLLKVENTISGGKSARGYRGGERKFNKVKFEVKKAWKFKINNFAFDVTKMVK
jgi:CRISPR-associated protein Csm3